MAGKRGQTLIPDTAPATGAVWRTARFEIDESRRELRVGGAVVELEAKPFDLLLMLTKRSGEVVTREQLLDVVWHGRVLSDSALAKCVSKLRMALGDQRQELVLTVHGIGYRLGLPAQRGSAAAPAAATPPPASSAALLSLLLGQAIGTIRYGDSLGAHIRPGDAMEVASAIDAWRSQGHAAADDMGALLEQAAALIEARFRERPEIYGPTHLNLAAGLQNLGRRETAHALLRRALRHVETQGSPLTLELRVQLADLSIEMGRHDEAAELLQQVLVEAEAWHGARSTAMLDARHGLARLEYERGHHPSAVLRLRTLLADVERWYPQSEDRASTVRWQLAKALLAQGQLEEAEQLLGQVIRRWGLRFDPASAVYHELRLSMGQLRMQQGRLGESLQIVEQLLQRTAANPAEHQRLRQQALELRTRLEQLREAGTDGKGAPPAPPA